ncbi:MAG: hypothetical protein HQ522_04745 [Bacteroidetes bacterium]|nr:hypothetical protein [Bacteroidota bacterium]
MSAEEFLNFIKRSEETEAYYKALYEGFSKQLPTALAEVVFNYLPKFKNNREKYEKAVFETATKYIREIWDEFDSVNSLNANGGPMADLNPAKKPTSKEDAEQKRLKEIKEIPKQHHKGYTKVFWESYEEELVGEIFVYAVYEKMKEVFTKFYIDDIMEFDSAYLRYFDRGLYLMCTLRFVDDIYSLL